MKHHKAVSETTENRDNSSLLWRICFVASLGGVLFGFDTAVISGTFSMVETQFGLLKIEVGWFGSSALIGAIVGAFVMVPEDKTFTTQAAANFLGVSRQHLVDQREEGKLAYHMVGSHRRVRFKDLLNYEKRRDSERRDTLDRLAHKIDAAGKYDSDYSGDE